MKNLYIICLTLFFSCHLAIGQTEYDQEILAFQDNLNKEFKDPETTPLEKRERRKFKKHDFFPVDQQYRVVAKFVKSDNPEFFQMKTTTRRIADYDIYGIAEFELNGKTFRMNIYQSHRLRKIEEYKDDLFMPFIDETNGKETYAAGRYIDLSIPEGDTIVIDFNKAYNPYCVYSYKYSCPIPPVENSMDTRVEAGIMAPDGKK